jgi:hypothetical protein
MFTVNGTRITIHRGDTGALVINLSGATLGNADRAVFTIANKNGSIVLMSQEYPIVDNKFTVQFVNDVTDKWNPGQYKWEVRVFFNPTRDGDNKIVNADEVRTLYPEPQDFVVSQVLYEA